MSILHVARATELEKELGSKAQFPHPSFIPAVKKQKSVDYSHEENVHVTANKLLLFTDSG